MKDSSKNKVAEWKQAVDRIGIRGNGICELRSLMDVARLEPHNLHLEIVVLKGEYLVCLD